MDAFIEKLVTRKKGMIDNLIVAGIVLATLIVIFIIINIPILRQAGISLMLAAGAVYLAYRFITGRNVEFEYVVTNGELDIDRIVSQRKRKRIFSASCKEFDIIAKVKSSSFDQANRDIKNKIDASSSTDSPDAYFFTLNYKGEKTMVIFEPDEKMLNNFKIFIPRKMLLN